MLNRAYSLVTVKDFDPVTRKFAGVATSPVPDRIGDVIEPDGIEYKNPLPLLLYHNSQKPVGEAVFRRRQGESTPFDATISTIDRESGVVKERLDEAVDSLAAKPPLIRGVSIGFRPLEDPVFIKETGGFRFPRVEVLELSMVVIPAHQDATIDIVKSLSAQHLAVSGEDGRVHTPGVSGTPVVRLLPSRSEQVMKTIAEQIASYKSTRDQKFQEQQALMTKAAESGVTLDAAQSEQYDTLDTEVKALDAHTKRLESLQTAQAAVAVPVAGTSPVVASITRGGDSTPVITVKDNLPPGIPFARSVMAKVVSRLDHRYVVDVVKEMFPGDARLLAYFQKANVAAGSTTNAVNAAALVDPTNLESEFVEFLRPATIVGKFGANGIPSLRRVPFNVRVTGQTTGGTAYWVGEGKPKPLTAFEFNATTLAYTKVAAIAVITQELARFSTPSAETLVRDALRDAVVERLDIDFIDPAQAAVANVNPASITNGLTALTSAGTSADNVRTDIQNLLEGFIAANQRIGSLVLIMPETLAMVLSLLVNDLGQREFPDISLMGGRLLGIPVITSQYAANASGSGNLVIAVNASEIFLADDGQVRVDMSTEASLQMLDNPTNDTVTPTPTTMVSMFQTDSIALRAERFINWAKRRSTAVVYMDDVNWGAIGSPA